MSGSSSYTCDETYVRGLSFKMASISTAMVCKVIRFTDARPKTFLSVDLVRPIKRPQKSPYHGARLGMNCQLTPCLLSDFFKVAN